MRVTPVNYSPTTFMPKVGTKFVFCADSINFTSKNIEDLSKTFHNPIEAVFSDIDGTIGYNGSIPKSAKAAIKELEHQNVPIILSTGRSSSETESLAKELEIKPDFTMYEQGAVIMDKNGKKIYENPLSRENAQKILDIVEEYKKQDPNTEVLFYIDGRTYATRPVIAPEHPHVKPITVDSFERLFDEGYLPTKALIVKWDSKTQEDIKPIEKILGERLNSDLTYASSCKWLVDVANVNSTKGRAIEFLSEKMGIELKNAACIGDAPNDMDMMHTINKFGGLSIAMGNGTQELKNKAKFVTADIKQDGYKKAMDAILKNNAILNHSN